MQYVPSKRVGAYGDGDRRMDAFLCAKVFQRQGKRPLSVPAEHQTMVAHIYDQLGMTYRMLPLKALSGENVYAVEFVHDMALAEMKVDNAGTDFAQELKQMMVDFYKNGIEVVKVCLNMSNPSAAKVYELFAAKGVFFAGILPGCESGEYLLLLHLMGLPMEWDKVVAIEGYQELLDYVREHAEG